MRITGTVADRLRPVISLRTFRSEDVNRPSAHQLLAERCTELQTVEFCNFLVDAKEMIKIIKRCTKLRKCKVLCDTALNYMDADEFVNIFNAAARTNIESLHLCSYDLHNLLRDMLRRASNLVELFVHLSPSWGDEERFSLDVSAIFLRYPNLKTLGLENFAITKPWENGYYELESRDRIFPLEKLYLYSIPTLPYLPDFLTKHCPNVRHIKMHNYHHVLLKLPYHTLDTLELCCRYPMRQSADNHVFSLQLVLPNPPTCDEHHFLLMLAEESGRSLMPPVWYRMYGGRNRKLLPPEDDEVQHDQVRVQRHRRLTVEERMGVSRKFQVELIDGDSEEEQAKEAAKQQASDSGIDQAFVEDCFSLISAGHFTGIQCAYINSVIIEGVPFIVNGEMIE